MKEFACGDVVPGCNAKFEAETSDEILAAVAVHAREAHGISEITQVLIDQVVAQIRVAA